MTSNYFVKLNIDILFQIYINIMLIKFYTPSPYHKS